MSVKKQTITSKVVQFIKDAGDQGVRYSDIVKYYIVHIKGYCTSEEFKFTTYRGYYASALTSFKPFYKNYKCSRYGILLKYCIKKDGRYIHKDNNQSSTTS